MLYTTYDKPVMRNGRLMVDNLKELVSMINDNNPKANIVLEIDDGYKTMEWDVETGQHMIMIDFMNGNGLILEQNGCDYRPAN